MEVNLRFKGYLICCVRIVLQMQKISHILAFVFLCLIQPPVSLRIRCQQPLHSREIITEVTGLYNSDFQISRLSKSSPHDQDFFWPSGCIVYTKLFFMAVVEIVLLKEF